MSSKPIGKKEAFKIAEKNAKDGKWDSMEFWLKNIEFNCEQEGIPYDEETARKIRAIYMAKGIPNAHKQALELAKCSAENGNHVHLTIQITRARYLSRQIGIGNVLRTEIEILKLKSAFRKRIKRSIPQTVSQYPHS